ncbi:hypothetical protein [Halomonas sp. HAL1]|uniref:hypothetical protein n=1 Tax=Halomonas sp. HAL1 TaxID=550984 RepID=UPI00022D2C2E|nr:hypothetical protein [Halomonas sp. HAL1]EHA17148.1 hypothetical protein HAL1_03102 [Halomonas sp. HAL1]WKV92869.1 hypothetical protein Q3Y66_18815 [Halomonas sp. HAL1]
MLKKIISRVLNFVAFFSFIGLLLFLYALTQQPSEPEPEPVSTSEIDANSGLYLTEDFKEGNEIAMLYICAITGHKTGMADDSLALLVKLNEYSGLERQRSGNLLDDANTWWEEESYAWDLDGMWKGECEQPLNNIRRTL